MAKHSYKKGYVVLDTKEIDWFKTIIVNLGSAWYPLMVLGFLVVSFKALDKQEFVDPFLKIPFIVIICGAALLLISWYKIEPKIIKKKEW